VIEVRAAEPEGHISDGASLKLTEERKWQYG